MSDAAVKEKPAAAETEHELTDGFNLLTTNGTTLFNDGTYLFYTNTVAPNDSFKYTVSDFLGQAGTGTVYIAKTGNIFGQTNPQLHITSTNITANFFGIPGDRYTIDRSTNLMIGPGWVAISTNTAPTNGLIQVIDTFHDLGVPPQPLPAAAYYRLRYNP